MANIPLESPAEPVHSDAVIALGTRRRDAWIKPAVKRLDASAAENGPELGTPDGAFSES